jgi:zona occludens toxin (predicted ATPase)
MANSCNLSMSYCPSSQCPDSPRKIASRGSRLTTIAFVVALLSLIVWGEIWAIENAPTLIQTCDSVLSTEGAQGDACTVALPLAAVPASTPVTIE